MPVCEKTVRNYLANLKRLGFIKIEIAYGNSRRISILPPGSQIESEPPKIPQNCPPPRNKSSSLIEIAEKELVTEKEKTDSNRVPLSFFSLGFSPQNPSPPQPLDFAYGEKSNSGRLALLEAKVALLESTIEAISRFLGQKVPDPKIPQGHPDRWPGPIRPDCINLPQLMTKLTPPNPGPQEMVDQVKEILDSPIQLGSKKYLLDVRDRAYFYGWSRSVLVEALSRTHAFVMALSKRGKICQNIPAMIFKYCAEVRRERNEN